MALLLNWVLCAQALTYYAKLQDDANDSFVKYWRGFFFFFALSTFFGGPSHLFFGYLGLLGKIPGWIAAAVSISFIEKAVISDRNSENKSIFNYLVFGKFALTILLLFIDLSFTWVMVHTAIGLVLILGVTSVNSVLKGKVYCQYFLFAVLSMMLALPFRLLDINLHLWFNRDDIGHVFMLTASYLFYLGIKEKQATTVSADSRV